jgi:hypothetical protein
MHAHAVVVQHSTVMYRLVHGRPAWSNAGPHHAAVLTVAADAEQ